MCSSNFYYFAIYNIYIEYYNIIQIIIINLCLYAKLKYAKRKYKKRKYVIKLTYIL